MISLDEAARQMGGAAKMALAAPDWRETLDRSMNAVFASFWAVALSAPLALLATATTMRAARRTADLGESVYANAPFAPLAAIDLAAFVADWAVNLAILVLVARFIGAGKKAAELIVGFNWITPMVTAIALPALAIIAATASTQIGGLVALPTLVLQIALIYGVVRRGLDLSLAPSAGIVALLILSSAIVDGLFDAFARSLLVSQA